MPGLSSSGLRMPRRRALTWARSRTAAAAGRSRRCTPSPGGWRTAAAARWRRSSDRKRRCSSYSVSAREHRVHAVKARRSTVLEDALFNRQPTFVLSRDCTSSHMAQMEGGAVCRPLSSCNDTDAQLRSQRQRGRRRYSSPVRPDEETKTFTEGEERQRSSRRTNRRADDHSPAGAAPARLAAPRALHLTATWRLL